MKKIYFMLAVVAVLAVSSKVIADVVTTRPVRPQASTPTTSRLVDSVKTCKPYSESLQTESMGMNFDFNIKILGWVNNKCVIDFVGKTNGAGSLFSSLYGVSSSDAEILSFEPNVHCEFTKSQLNSVGDSILQEEERNKGARNNMLKNPNDIDLTSFLSSSPSDAALMDVIFNQQACSIKNISNTPINGINLNSLFGF